MILKIIIKNFLLRIKLNGKRKKFKMFKNRLKIYLVRLNNVLKIYNLFNKIIIVKDI